MGSRPQVMPEYTVYTTALQRYRALAQVQRQSKNSVNHPSSGRNQMTRARYVR